MDINKIFGTFGSSSRDDGGFLHSPFLIQKVDIEENHPRYYVRMFIKLILNYTDYNNELIKLLGSSDDELDVNEISRAGEIMLYERAYNYLVKLDIKDKYHAKILTEEYRKHIIQKLENLEGKLKHIDFYNGRGDKKEIETARKKCEELVEEIKSSIEREPQTPNEINKY